MKNRGAINWDQTCRTYDKFTIPLKKIIKKGMNKSNFEFYNS